jgi:hypothetical protein
MRSCGTSGITVLICGVLASSLAPPPVISLALEGTSYSKCTQGPLCALQGRSREEIEGIITKKHEVCDTVKEWSMVLPIATDIAERCKVSVAPSVTAVQMKRCEVTGNVTHLLTDSSKMYSKDSKLYCSLVKAREPDGVSISTEIKRMVSSDPKGAPKFLPKVVSHIDQGLRGEYLMTSFERGEGKRRRKEEKERGDGKRRRKEEKGRAEWFRPQDASSNGR